MNLNRLNKALKFANSVRGRMANIVRKSGPAVGLARPSVAQD